MDTSGLELDVLEPLCYRWRHDRSEPKPRGSGFPTFRCWKEEEEPKKQSEMGNRRGDQ